MVRGGKESKQLLFEERTMEDLTSVPPIASNRDEDGMDAAGDAIGTSTRVDDECLFLGTLRDTAAEMCNLKEESSLTIEVNNNDDAKIQKKPLARTCAYRSTPERCKDGFWDVVKAKKAV